MRDFFIKDGRDRPTGTLWHRKTSNGTRSGFVSVLGTADCTSHIKFPNQHSLFCLNRRPCTLDSLAAFVLALPETNTN